MHVTQFHLILPEAILAVLVCAILLIDLFERHPKRTTTYVLSLTTLLGLAMCYGLRLFAAMPIQTAMSEMVVHDPMGDMLKMLACVVSAGVLVLGRDYAYQRGMLRGGEFFTLSLFALLGVLIMISAHHMLVIYLGLELLTLSSYALVAVRRDDARAIEASMKYFVLGALASGFLLYGMSMLYGATGSLALPDLYKAVGDILLTQMQGGTTIVSQQVLVLGLVFVVAGLAFKLGLAPFHMWIPDVYHGAPTAVALMIGAAPKLAAFAIAVRFLIRGLLPLALHWQQMLIVLAVVSLFLGNFAAVAQTNFKRMLAYSTIAQMGFMLLGLATGVVGVTVMPNIFAWAASMFYVIVYVLTTMVSFGVIMLLSRTGFESEEIADFAGLNQRSPFFAGIMLICLLSLAGIPLFAGFFAKYYVLQMIISGGSMLHIILAVYAVLMSLIGAFYYIRVIKVMYFDAPAQTAPIEASGAFKVVLGISGLLLLVFGLWPAPLMNLSTAAFIYSQPF